jgi:hypothetical protein
VEERDPWSRSLASFKDYKQRWFNRKCGSDEGDFWYGLSIFRV